MSLRETKIKISVVQAVADDRNYLLLPLCPLSKGNVYASSGTMGLESSQS